MFKEYNRRLRRRAQMSEVLEKVGKVALTARMAKHDSMRSDLRC